MLLPISDYMMCPQFSKNALQPMNTPIDIDNDPLEKLLGMLTPEAAIRMDRLIRKQVGVELDNAGYYVQKKPMKHAPKRGMPWTANDDMLLRRYYELDRQYADEIAEQLGRTITGIVTRIVKLGIESDEEMVRRKRGGSLPSPRQAPDTKDTDTLKEKRTNEGKPWKQAHDEQLIHYYENDRLGADAIGKLMGRTTAGIKARAVRLELETDRKNVRN